MTLTLKVPRKGFSCDGHIIYHGRLWDCVAARLVEDDQIELELRQVPDEAQFEVARHQQRRKSVACSPRLSQQHEGHGPRRIIDGAASAIELSARVDGDRPRCDLRPNQ